LGEPKYIVNLGQQHAEYRHASCTTIRNKALKTFGKVVVART
jgi:hypothetical protein